MSDLYWLTDEQMARLSPYFPKSHGKPRVDDRRVLSLERTSEIYAHADPLKMKSATRALTRLWKAVEHEADKWRADHLLTISEDNNKVLVKRDTRKR